MNDSSPIRLYLSAEHACGYLSGRAARSAFVDPEWTLNAPRYQRLLEMGFRRSGGHVYRPHCRDCTRCIPVRVPVARFRPSRSQRRCLDANTDLQLSLETRLGDEHYALYRSYLLGRHADGGMDPYDRQAFHAFLECPWAPVNFWCFRAHGRLLSVAVVDHLPLALSAVYTFFDPQEAARGLGTLAVLQQIRHAQERGLPYVYLGYWVPESGKMAYKQRFQPLETLTARGWLASPTPAVGG
ncbi:arginyltransferase [Fontimonas sp. SYSU GA230001]|uniref:arginyltransferase n=1 Tax=Fontimonas sp. SYSU GA230001 TaxID=3142450 RepID=UPI0032B34B95